MYQNKHHYFSTKENPRIGGEWQEVTMLYQWPLVPRPVQGLSIQKAEDEKQVMNYYVPYLDYHNAAFLSTFYCKTINFAQFVDKKDTLRYIGIENIEWVFQLVAFAHSKPLLDEW